MMKAYSLSLALLFLVLPASKSQAWGNRGHFTICESAVHLVQNKSLSSFLKPKAAVMGYLCNIPDTSWKNLGPDISKQGNATHFVNPEIFGLMIKDVPLDYTSLIKTYKGSKNLFKEGTIYSVPLEFGSNWWRADQFFRRAVAAENSWVKVTTPMNAKEEQDENLPFNKLSYDFYVNLGLMGHFVGDNGQPIHSTADYDGYRAGHGGIHSFYEEAVVGAFSHHFSAQVVEQGLKLQRLVKTKDKSVQFLREKSVLEKMRALSALSIADISQIYKLDSIKKPSILKEEKGMQIKTPAEREAPELVKAKYEKMIVLEMARSAALLAQLWDLAYEEIGQPKLTSYKSYKYPFTPDFVPPDYFDLSELEKNPAK